MMKGPLVFYIDQTTADAPEPLVIAFFFSLHRLKIYIFPFWTEEIRSRTRFEMPHKSNRRSRGISALSESLRASRLCSQAVQG